jgi:bifunctional non-homologous end joining protein LigD
VVRDNRGVSRFQLLQQGSSRPIYVTFDCLFRDGVDLRHEPLSARRAILERCIGAGPTIAISRRLGANGLKAFKKAKHEGYEGLVAKELSAPYVEGRSAKWLKVKVRQEDEFVICGYTKPRGARRYLGALLLGAYDQKELRYVGKVGTGFDDAILAALHRKLQPLVTARIVLADAPRASGLRFVSPKLVAQISFQEWTRDKKLRQPVFLGLRDDKSATEVMLPPIPSS